MIRHRPQVTNNVSRKEQNSTAVVEEDNSHSIILKPIEWDHLDALKE
jgi:hypothetical protein